MKKIIVEESLCIGCGACIAIDPEHFDFNDNGFSTCISNKNLDSEALQNAIEACPTGAIKLVEDASDNEEVEDDSSEFVLNTPCEACSNKSCECN